jgi:aspartyl-tRNA(Asn)/glutamyl-tRNA(Gln) amidotransferase subunit B
MKYKTVLGLETHVELKTKQKMFCGCSANYFGHAPNTNVCPVCLGMPGALPVPNAEAIAWTILIAKALNCKINLQSYFERKHYFYPDLPKGYQISQYLKPFGYDGYLMVGNKKIQIERVHLEEDTGKLLHGQNEHSTESYVDFNRSSVPLVEIVTRPDLESSLEAVSYLKSLQLLIRYLGVSNADMEKGSMRCEPNISLVEASKWARSKKLPNYKVEIKNINSFRFVKKAIEFEEGRQALLLDEGKTPLQETRRYLESTGKTEGMRSKENAHDYRYFPEPDIPPFDFDQAYLDEIESKLKQTELPKDRVLRLVEEFKLTDPVAEALTDNKVLGDTFFALITSLDFPAKDIANVLVNKKVEATKPLSVLKTEIRKLLTKTGLSESQLKKVVTSILTSQPKAVADYRSGKGNSFQFLLGQVLKVLGRQVEVNEVVAQLKAQLLDLK